MASEKMTQLIKKREELEADIKELHDVLDSQKSVGMDGPLVDAEGFPRADVDIYSVRHARHQIICLQNDYKALMTEIEEELYRIHAEARLASGTSADRQSDQAVVATPTALREPIGTVISIDVGSPAETAGLKVGDKVVQFGSLTAENFQGLQNIASVVQHSVDRSLTVTVIRDQTEVKLSITPTRWKPEKGLLGCNIKPEKPKTAS